MFGVGVVFTAVQDVHLPLLEDRRRGTTVNWCRDVCTTHVLVGLPGRSILKRMCGIVGYVGRERIPATALLECMRLMQTDREKWERTPVGGHGAGLAARRTDDHFTTVKVGGNGDPVAALRDEISRTAPRLLEAGSDVLMGHVRRAVPRFLSTVARAEATQPYVASCWENLQVIGIHNGFASNYGRLLSRTHRLESAHLGPVDSETLPHLVEELLTSGRDPHEAMGEVARRIRGGNAAFFIVRHNGSTWAGIVHVGKTRGLTVWENSLGELLLVSRPRCLGSFLRSVIDSHGFRVVFRVGRREAARFTKAWRVRDQVNTPAPDSST